MEIVPWLLLVPITLLLSWFDVREHRLPNPLVAIALVVGLIGFGGAGPLNRFSAAILSSLGLFLFYLFLAGVSRDGLGMGDVKLAAVIGLYLGFLSPSTVFSATWLTFLLGGLVVIGGMLFGGLDRRSRIPFGPFMLAGMWLAAGSAVLF